MAVNFVIPQKYIVASRVYTPAPIETPVVDKGKRNGKRSRR